MTKWATQLLAGIILIIITSIATIFITNYQNRIQYLDYVVYKSESILGKPNNIWSDSINFTVNGKQVKDISELDIYFLNKSKNDFKDLPIIIEFHQPDNWTTISHNALDQNNAKELVEELPLKASKYVRFGYKVELLNRKNDDPVLSLKFLIEGKTIPNFRIYVNQDGIDTREYDKSNYQFFSDYFYTELGPLIFSTIVVVTLFNLFQWWFEARRKGRKSPEEIQRELDILNNSDQP